MSRRSARDTKKVNYKEQSSASEDEYLDVDSSFDQAVVSEAIQGLVVNSNTSNLTQTQPLPWSEESKKVLSGPNTSATDNNKKSFLRPSLLSSVSGGTHPVDKAAQPSRSNEGAQPTATVQPGRSSEGAQLTSHSTVLSKQNSTRENSNDVTGQPVRARVSDLRPTNQSSGTIRMAQNYDVQNGTDDDRAMQSAVAALKGYKFDKNDLEFYFGRVEIQMKSNGVKKNFTKLEVLTTILPSEVIEEIKPLLRKQESDFPNNDAYKQVKDEILRIFGLSDASHYQRAKGRVLSGKPSQLARAIMNDMCDKQLEGCCCHKWVFGLWHEQLPSGVIFKRLKVSNSCRNCQLFHCTTF